MATADSLIIGKKASGPRASRPACFTLIELVLVVVLVGILAAVGVGVFGGSVAHHQASGAQQRIDADLMLARQRAMTTGANQPVRFAATSDRYALTGVPNPDKPGSDYTTDLSALPYEADIVSVDLGGDSEIIFDAYGTPDSGGTIVIRVGDRQITLTVSAENGRVTAP
ncbi:MAG: GspH/FimT family protein [Phycisphaerae bacterium]|nr:GspH/FimT family protein [Phycisphaerae bacterium]